MATTQNPTTTTTTTTAAGAPSLTFPREIFAALSPSPFLLAHLTTPQPQQNQWQKPQKQQTQQQTLRPNARTTSAFRAPTVNTSSLTHCHGSAVVRLGDTAVVAGVRGEILYRRDVPDPPRGTSTEDANDASSGEAEDDGDDRAEIDKLGLLVPNVELATGASPKHLPGSPPSAQAQSLTARLLNLLRGSGVVRARDLRISYTEPRVEEGEGMLVEGVEVESENREVKAWWTLYIDVLFISLDGNAFDAAWGAVMAALGDTKLPRAWWERDVECVVCDDGVKSLRGLSLRGLPVAASWGVFEHREEGQKNTAWMLADPDLFEEGLCREVVTVVVDRSGGKTKVLRVEKSGGGVVGKEVLRTVVTAAERRWTDWRGLLKEQ
ncbi:ribosomal protein S5 domain 2-like protein [Saccharata proteae CBS 121410]|uniref:Ribosomal RNA-processing protein 43 n=1 Tax=Saccharata proteae CBS 121410 TaxID=1314787 RepID=A0A9P4HQL5_9PEZI|nr:ribosomal protein S5 domain 2-like protein [Saccharata proteae CBS 121410]